VIGTYSSIFVATTLLVVWERQARKAKGQLTQAELKPLVEKPSQEALRTVGADTSFSRPAEADSAGNDSGVSQERAARPKSTAAKRRKRRF